MVITNVQVLDTLGFDPYWLPGQSDEEKPKFAEGIIRVRRIPDGWTDEEYRAKWLPETDGHGKVLKPAWLNEREKQGLEIARFENAILNAGRTQVLTYIGSSSGNSVQWSQYFAVGTGAITGISPISPSLSNEVFRKAQTSYSVNGTLVDINFQFGTTDAEYTYTNAGIFGHGASGTLGSGTLHTQALFSFTKGAFAIAIDYLINLL